jgi:hypothetical protein
MSKYTFDDDLFWHGIDGDLGEIRGCLNSYHIARRLRVLLCKNEGLRNASTTIKFNYSIVANNIVDMLERYRRFTKKPETLGYKDLYMMFTEDYKAYKTEKAVDKTHVYGADISIFSDIVNNIKNLVSTCDKINEFTQLAYRVDTIPETKFTKTTPKDIMEFDMSSIASAIAGDYNDVKIFDTMDIENVNSQEYGKMMCKRTKALKAEILSTANKYFGKNSKLGEFNIMDHVN